MLPCMACHWSNTDINTPTHTVLDQSWKVDSWITASLQQEGDDTLVQKRQHRQSVGKSKDSVLKGQMRSTIYALYNIYTPIC